MAEIDDLLNAAKGSLTNAATLSRDSGLDAANAENAKNLAAFEQHKAEQGLVPDAVGRFLKGGWSQSVVNPRNWGGVVSGILHPVKNIIEPSAEAFKRSVEAHDAPTKATELMRSVPIVGTPTVNATEKMLNGDVAGGAGELAGIISNFPVSEAAAKATPGAVNLAGRGTSAVGRGMQAVGEKAINAKVSPGMAATMEVMTGHPYAAAATVGAPYGLKYGGVLVEKAGNALQSLSKRNVGTPAEAPVGMEYPESWKPFINRENVSSEVATAPESGWGSPETYTRSTTPSTDLSNSPAMQGLRGSTTSYSMRQEAAAPSYDRPSVPYSSEAVDWLQAHTPQQPIQDFINNEVIGRDRTTGLTEDNLADVANRARLARQGLLASQ